MYAKRYPHACRASVQGLGNHLEHHETILTHTVLTSRSRFSERYRADAYESCHVRGERAIQGDNAEYRGMLTGMLRRRVGLQVVRAFARQRLRRVGLVGIPRTEIDGWRERQQRDRTLGSRGSDALVRLSDVLAYAAEYRAHTPHGVMP